MANEIITRKDFKESNDSILKSKQSAEFWHYTSLKNVDSILGSKSFYATSIEGMNDLDEKGIHESEKDSVHVISFCNSKTEKIPMWYLYSGIAGQGAAIGFTLGVLKNFINSIDKVYGISKDGKKTELRKGENFDFEYGFVCYKKNNSTTIKYRGKWKDIKNEEEFVKNNFFIKSYPWEYEKEFRIVIYNNTKVKYDKIEVKFDNIEISKLKVKLAPEINKSQLEEKISGCAGIKEYIFSKILNSELSINMDLFKRNINGFVDVISTELPNSSLLSKEDCLSLCKSISSFGKCANQK